MSEGTSAGMAPVPAPPASAAHGSSGGAGSGPVDGHAAGQKGTGQGAPWPPAPESTGDDDVDAQLALLRQLPDLPVADHGDLYATLHDGLRAALDDMPRDS